MGGEVTNTSERRRNGAADLPVGPGALTNAGSADLADAASSIASRPVWQRPGIVALFAIAAGTVAADRLPSLPPSAWGLLIFVAVAAALAARLLLFRQRWLTAAALIGAIITLGGLRSAAVLHTTAGDDLRAAIERTFPDHADPALAPSPSSARADRSGSRNKPPAPPTPLLIDVLGIVEAVETAAPPTTPGDPEHRAERPVFELDPQRGFTPTDHRTAALRVLSVGGVAVSGRLTLSAPFDVALRPGQVVIATGRYLPPPDAQVPGSMQRQRTAHAAGHAGTLLCPSAGLVRIQTPAQIEERSALTVVERTRVSAALALDKLADGARSALLIDRPGATAERTEARALIAALLLGEYQPEVRQTADRFARLGLLHALSISGFHIAVLAGVAGLLLRLVGFTRRGNRLIVLAIVLLYVLMLPTAAPISRSALSMVLLSLMLAIGRGYDGLNTLGFVGASLALVNPVDVFTPGFGLTFLATGALLRFSGPAAAWASALGPPPLRGALAERWSPWPLLFAVLRALLAAAAIGLVISLLTAPSIVLFSGWLSVIGVLASLLLAPFVSGILVLVLVGLVLAGLAHVAAMAIGLFWAEGGASISAWPISEWCLWPAYVLSELTLIVVRIADGVPLAAVVMPPFPAGWGELWAVLTTAVTWATCERWLIKRREPQTQLIPVSAPIPGHTRATLSAALRRSSVPVLGIGCAAVLLWLPLRGDPDAAGAGRIDRLSTGAGSVTLIRGLTPTGPGVLLIDPGSRNARGGPAAATTLRRALRELGLWAAPTVLLTSPEVTHAGALLDSIAGLRIRQVLLPAPLHRLASESPGHPLAELVRRLRARGVDVIPLSPDAALVFGQVRLDVTPTGIRARLNDQPIELDAIGPQALVTWPDPNGHIPPGPAGK